MARRVVPKRLVPLLGSRIAGEKGDIASMYLEDGYLVVTFVDEEKEPLRVPMDFYSKAESDAKYVTFAGDEVITGKKTMHKIVADGYLAIPTSSPSASLNPPSDLTYLYSGSGNYAEIPSGGVANVYPFSIRNGSRYLGEYDVSLQRWDINFASLFSPYALSTDLNSYVNNATYDSDTKKIYLKNGSTNIAEIDATEFIKDGMVSSVTIEDGYLVISFNTDAGQSPIRIALTDIFNPDNYYTKTNIDTLLGGYYTKSQIDTTLGSYVNSLEQGAGNYVIGISKDGNKLSVSRGTLPAKLSDFIDDVVAGNYLPIHGTADKALRLSDDTAHTAWGQTFWQNGVPKTISGSLTSVTNITGSGLITMPKAKFSSSLIIPHVAPSGTLESGETYLYAGTGDYAEMPSGGGVADIYDLTIRKNGTSLGTYNLGTAAADINIPIGWGDLTENSAHRFLTDTMISTWNAKQNAISDLATIRAGAALGATALQSETDPVFSASAASGITSDDISAWNAKYDKPSGGIPKSDLATSVQTSLGKADTALQSESDPTVSAWAKKSSLEASDVPTLAISKISGLQDALDGKQPLDADLTAIAALTGSGLLRRNSNNTWSLDTNTYLTSSDHKALTLKVGTITIGSDFNSLAAKTYTITKANLTDTIGDTTYAPYNADGYVPTTRTVNGHPLSSDIALTLDDINDGTTRSLENYLPLTAGSGKPLTGTLYTRSIIPTGGYSIGSSSNRFNTGWFNVGQFNVLNSEYGDILWIDATSALSIPTNTPNTEDTHYDSSLTYLWADADGNYSEIPGGGVADIYDLTVRKNGTSLGTYNLGEQAADINIPIGWADLTEDASHKFVSQSEKDTWSAKQNAISDLTTIRGNANKGATAYSWGDHSLAGYATEQYVGNAISALGLGTASKRNVTDSVSQNNNNLPTSGAVYSAIAAAVTSALHYRGMSSTQLTDGGTEVAVIGGTSLVAQSGDVVIYGGFEFLWEEGHWNKLGDDSSYAIKTVSISAGTGLTGGGDLTAARTISLSQSTIDSLALADSALQSSDMKALTLKVGSITVASNFNALTARTYTITKANITDTIGSTTYAPYHADGYLPLSGGTLTGTLYTQHILPSSALGGYNIGSETAPFGSGYFSGSLLAEESVETYDVIAHGTADLSVRLAIPTSAPTSPASGKTYLWADEDGNYAETAGGGGSATVYDLTIRKNGTAIGTYNLGTQAADVNITVGWSDLTPDASHRFLTDSLISTWNGKYTKPVTGIPKTDLARAVQTSLGLADTALQSVPLATDSTIGGFKTGTGTYLDLANDGVLYVDIDGISTYMSDDGFLKSVAFSDLTSHPTTLAGYGITDAASASDLANYLPLSGNSIAKSITGNVFLANGKYLQGVTTGGEGRNLIGYNTSNQVVVGNANNNLYLVSTSTVDLYHTKGSTSYKIYDASNLTKSALTTLLEGDNGYYLKLTGGTLTGGLTLSNVNQVFDVSTTTRSIYYKASDAVSYRGIMFGTNGDLTVGYDGPSHSKSLYLDGFNEYLRFGATKQYSVKLNSTGTVELGGISAVLPVTTNEVNLGSSAKAFNNIYGKLDLSYLQSASDLKAIEALTGTGLAKRTADNTWELTDTADKAEELATFSEEDAMFTYRQVPSEAVGDVLKATAVKGKSVVWNQQFPDVWSNNYLYKTDGTSISYSGHSAIWTPVSGKVCILYMRYSPTTPNYFPVIFNHHYLITRWIKTTTACHSTIYTGSNWQSESYTADGQWHRYDSIYTFTAYTTQGHRICQVDNGTTINGDIEIKDIQVIDLTAAGLDDLTAAEFEALYPDYHAYNAGELVNNAASGVEMLDAGGNSLGTIPLNITELTSNGVQIFSDGMKSAGSVSDEWSGTTATKRIKKLVVSGSNTVANNNVGNSHERQYIVFSDAVAPTGSVVGNIICNKYSAATANETYSHSRDKIIAVSSSYLYIYDSELIGKTAAEVKEALLGLEILYETKTPQTYTTDPLPDTLVPFESGGTQRRLPVDTTSEVIAPMVCDFQYGANMSDVAKAYLPLSGGTVTGTLEAAGELIIPDSAPRNPDSTKVYLYCDTTGNYYTE